MDLTREMIDGGYYCPEERATCADFPHGCEEGCPAAIYQKKKAELDPYVLWLLRTRALQIKGFIGKEVFDFTDKIAILVVESVWESLKMKELFKKG